MCTPSLLQLVLNNEESSLEYLLRDPPCPTDSVAVKDHCVSHHSHEGFTVFHYAAKQQAIRILKALVEFCEGKTPHLILPIPLVSKFYQIMQNILWEHDLWSVTSLDYSM